MLFEFHRQQNGKRPGSVSATYLVTGFQTVTPPAAPNGLADGDGDIPMPSSPYLSSPAPPQASQEEPVRQRVITLAKEDHLDCMAATLLDPQDRQRLIGKAIKEKYVEISSIHVYSVGLSSIKVTLLTPARCSSLIHLKNLQILSNVTQQIIANYIGEDPLVHNTTYGVIQNPNVKVTKISTPPGMHRTDRGTAKNQCSAASFCSARQGTIKGCAGYKSHKLSIHIQGVKPGTTFCTYFEAGSEGRTVRNKTAQ